MDLGKRAVVAELHVQFQGGFAGRECEVRAAEREGEEWREIARFHPSDNNSIQVSFTDTLYNVYSQLHLERSWAITF